MQNPFEDAGYCGTATGASAYPQLQPGQLKFSRRPLAVGPFPSGWGCLPLLKLFLERLLAAR
eukprot:scaffold259544_cov26-Tisochrysis_lutea.AAC.1